MCLMCPCFCYIASVIKWNVHLYNKHQYIYQNYTVQDNTCQQVIYNGKYKNEAINSAL